jgi:hypothetical protein
MGLIPSGLASAQILPPGDDFNPGRLDVASSNPAMPGGRDGRIDLADLAVFSYYWMMRDSVPPSPNPAQWGKRGGTLDGRPSPGSSPTEIIMTAACATDQWGWDVAYQFECTKINNQSASVKSPWLYYPAGIDPTWVATGLQQDTVYTFVVRVAEIRVPGTLAEAGYDVNPNGPTEIMSKHVSPSNPTNSNWTVNSVQASSRTGLERNPPAPIAWEIQPYQNSVNSVSMTAVAASDEHPPVSYIFKRYLNAGDQVSDKTVGPTQSRTWVDTDVQLGQIWTYSFVAVDNLGNTSDPAPRVTVTIIEGDFNPPLPNPMTWAIAPVRVYIDGQWYDFMQATVAVDPENTVVEYQVRETEQGTTTPWRTEASDYQGPDWGIYPGNAFWIPASGQYTVRQYQCRARDTSPNQNTTAWSTPPLQPQH